MVHNRELGRSRSRRKTARNLSRHSTRLRDSHERRKATRNPESIRIDDLNHHDNTNTMSQTTETSEITSIRSVESNRESAGVAIAAVVAEIGRGVFAGITIAGGAYLAWRRAVKASAAKRASEISTQELRPLPKSLRADVMAATSLRAALSTLAGAGTRLTDNLAVESLIEKASICLRLGHEKDARQALSALTDEAASQHQRLLADCVLAHAEAVVRERGYVKIRIVPERGYLLAERLNGESVRLDVTRSRDGLGVRYAVDADGFTDDHCVEEVAAIHAGMQGRGVAGQVIRSVRKPRIPVGHKAARVAQTA